MRYDEMSRIYPWIEELFALVAGQIHAGATADMTIHYIERQIRQKIREEHQQAVTDKLTRFACVVEENSKTNDIALHKAPQVVKIVACPYCGSLDIKSGVCMWCHSESAG